MDVAHHHLLLPLPSLCSLACPGLSIRLHLMLLLCHMPCRPHTNRRLRMPASWHSILHLLTVAFRPPGHQSGTGWPLLHLLLLAAAILKPDVLPCRGLALPLALPLPLLLLPPPVLAAEAALAGTAAAAAVSGAAAAAAHPLQHHQLRHVVFQSQAAEFDGPLLHWPQRISAPKGGQAVPPAASAAQQSNW